MMYMYITTFFFLKIIEKWRRRKEEKEMNETISNQFSPQNFSLRVEQREPLTSSLGEDEWLLVAARNPGSVTVEGEGRHTERRIRGNKVNIYSALSSVVAQILSLCRLLPAIWQRFTFNFLGGNLELIWDQNSISLHMVYPLHTPVWGIKSRDVRHVSRFWNI